MFLKAIHIRQQISLIVAVTLTTTTVRSQDRLAPWYCGDKYAVCLEEGTKITTCKYDMVVGSDCGLAIAQDPTGQYLVSKAGLIYIGKNAVDLEHTVIYPKHIMGDSSRYKVIYASLDKNRTVILVDMIERRIFHNLRATKRSQVSNMPQFYTSLPLVLQYHRNDSTFIFGVNGLIVAHPEAQFDIPNRCAVVHSKTNGVVIDLRGDTLLRGQISPSIFGSCGHYSLGIYRKDSQCYCINREMNEDTLTQRRITCGLYWSIGDYEWIKQDDELVITRSGKELITLDDRPYAWWVGDTVLIARYEAGRLRRLFGPSNTPEIFDKFRGQTGRYPVIETGDSSIVYDHDGKLVLTIIDAEVLFTKNSHWLRHPDGSTTIYDSVWRYIMTTPKRLYKSLENQTLIYTKGSKWGIMDTAHNVDSGALFNHMPEHLTQHWYAVKTDSGKLAYSTVLDSMLPTYDSYDCRRLPVDELVAHDLDNRWDDRYSVSDGTLIERVDRDPKRIKTSRFRLWNTSGGRMQLIDKHTITVIGERPCYSGELVHLDGSLDQLLWWCNCGDYAELYDTTGLSILPPHLKLVAKGDLTRFATIDRLVYIHNGKYGIMDGHIQPVAPPLYGYIKQIDDGRYFARLADSTGVVLNLDGQLLDSVPYYHMYKSMSDYLIGKGLHQDNIEKQCKGRGNTDHHPSVHNDRFYLHWLDKDLTPINYNKYISLSRSSNHVLGSLVVDCDTVTHLYRKKSLVGTLPYYRHYTAFGSVLAGSNATEGNLPWSYDLLDTTGRVLHSDVSNFIKLRWRGLNLGMYY